MKPIYANRCLTSLATRLAKSFAPSSVGLPISIAMYHVIDHTPGPYSVTPEAFRTQLTLIAGRHPIIRLSELSELFANPTDTGRCVVITCDDAYWDFIAQALPILEELGIPCTLFVPTGHIGDENTWSEDEASGAGRRILGEDALRQLAGHELVDLGSHTVDHVRMSALDRNEMRRQAEESKCTLEELTGLPVRSFAYPYGQLDDYSAATTAVLAEVGYELAVTTHWGTSQTAPLALRRIHFTNEDDEGDLCAKLDGDDDWRTMKERLGFALRRSRPRQTGNRSTNLSGEVL